MECWERTCSVLAVCLAVVVECGEHTCVLGSLLGCTCSVLRVYLWSAGVHLQCAGSVLGCTCSVLGVELWSAGSALAVSVPVV